MFRGVYTATSGMIATQRKQEMLTQNLANLNTPGYKADQTVLRAFPDLLIQRIRAQQGGQVKGLPALPGQNTLGILHSGVYAQEAIPLFRQGPLRETGRALDLAIVDQDLVNPNEDQPIKGYLFFAVREEAEDEDGEAEIFYTRNGQFALDPEGYLVTNAGYYVLDEEGQPIQLTNPDFRVLEDGTILQAFDDNPEEFYPVGRLGLYYTEQPERLSKLGHDLYRFVPENDAEEDEENVMQQLGEVEFLNNMAPGQSPFMIKQGFVEGSNVDAVQTMTEMLSTYRLYEANQRVLQAYDRSMEKLVNEVGRVF